MRDMFFQRGHKENRQNGKVVERELESGGKGIEKRGPCRKRRGQKGGAKTTARNQIERKQVGINRVAQGR